MTGFTGISGKEWSGDWFVVLPDADRGAGWGFAGGVSDQIAHPSGRPWIIGHWPPARLLAVQAGPVRVVLIGCHDASAGQLAALANGIDSIDEFDRIGAAVSGSFHLIAAVGGEVRVQGSVSGVRRLFHRRVADLPVVSDRADVLAAIAGVASVPTEKLAVRLLYPSIPTALLDRPDLWPGVRAVPPDSYLRIDAHRATRCVRRWSPPDPTLSLAEGAKLLREELAHALDARTRGGVVATDLSGGLDSTPLSFLAAKTADRLITVTMGAESPDHDDAHWASAAAAALPTADHLVLDTDSLPDMFAGVDDLGCRLDEPMLWTRTRQRNLAIARICADRGASIRITGHGGDEVIHAPLAHLHTLARKLGRSQARRRLRVCAARYRWNATDAARAIKDSRPYGQWLADTARMLTQPPDLGGPEAMFGWSTPMRMPPWVSPTAVDAARGALQQLSHEAVAPDRGGHMAIHQVRQLGSSVRLASQLCGAETGLRIEAPFLDDRVLDICLAVDPAERNRADAYKPLMVEAMNGVVPPEILRRTTKGEFSADVHGGRRRQRAALAAVFEAPLLADLGLVDGDALRRAATGLFPPHVPLFALDSTLAVETWLRSRSGVPDAVG
ncbi:asparagine synthase-related protein [Fodinicola acaciae]|uniref:asparagine synthase-related protein n=1 Tax=Fodinicola acaciae TaxID=2681555 RepID=UPI0013D16135|nr:asparagine synthase-related protein [Fodinicola acaciae]